MEKIRIFLPLLLTLLWCGCSKPTEPAGDAKKSEAPPTSYVVKGLLRSINFADRSVTVEHEEVPDYMPSMTMPFDVKSMSEVEPLKVGDGMKFKLVVTDRQSWIEGIEKIEASEVKIAPQRTAIVQNASKVDRLKEGDRLPEFALVDQDGEKTAPETYRGRPLLLTFIFTRCPIPNFCPLMSRNFRDIQDELASEDPKLAASVSYLSISFDPKFDTPEILKNYSDQYHADGKQWRFATGSEEQIKSLTQAFSVYIQPEQGTITHGLVTAVVDGDGVIRKMFRGNSWYPAEAVKVLRTLPGAETAKAQ